MTDLMKYNAANFNQLLDRINRNSIGMEEYFDRLFNLCLLYTSPSPRDKRQSRMPSSA